MSTLLPITPASLFGFKILLRPHSAQDQCVRPATDQTPTLTIGALPAAADVAVACMQVIVGLDNTAQITLLPTATHLRGLIVRYRRSSSTTVICEIGRFDAWTSVQGGDPEVGASWEVAPGFADATRAISLRVPNTNLYLRRGADGRVALEPRSDDAQWQSDATFLVDIVDPAERIPVLSPRPDGTCDPLPLTGPALSLASRIGMEYRVRTRDGLAFVEDWPDERSQRESAFRIVPGVADLTHVSIQSLASPGHYLRNDGGRLKLSPWEEGEAWRRSATFMPCVGLYPGLQRVSFRAYGDPQSYIRMRDWELYVERSDGSAGFRSDATFGLDYRGPAERVAERLYITPTSSSASGVVEPTVGVLYHLKYGEAYVGVPDDAIKFTDQPNTELRIGVSPETGGAQFRFEYPPAGTFRDRLEQGHRGPFYLRTRTSGQYISRTSDGFLRQHHDSRSLFELVRTGPDHFRIRVFREGAIVVQSASSGAPLVLDVSESQQGHEFQLVPAQAYRGVETADVSAPLATPPSIFVYEILRDVIGDGVGKLTGFPGGSGLTKFILTGLFPNERADATQRMLQALHDQIIREVSAMLSRERAALMMANVATANKRYMLEYAAERSARLEQGGSEADINYLAGRLDAISDAYDGALTPLIPEESGGRIVDNDENYNRCRAGLAVYALAAAGQLNMLQESLLMKSCLPTYNFESYIRDYLEPKALEHRARMLLMFEYVFGKRSEKVVASYPGGYKEVTLIDDFGKQRDLYRFSGGTAASAFAWARDGLRPFWIDNLRWAYEHTLYPYVDAATRMYTLPTNTLLLCRKIRADGEFREWFLHGTQVHDQGPVGRSLSKPAAMKAFALPAEHDPNDLTTESGGVFIIQAKHSGKYLSVESRRTDAGAPLVQSALSAASHQRFELIHHGSGEFSLSLRHTGMMADVTGQSLSAGTAIIQWPSNDGDNQRFRIEPIGDGYHHIVGKQSGLALDVAGSGQDDGVRVLQWTRTNNDNQRWRFIPVEQLFTVNLSVLVHIGEIGDCKFGSDQVAGRDSNRIEGLAVTVAPAVTNLNVEYMAHIRNLGDTAWTPGGSFCGTRGQALALEGFAIRLTGAAASAYSIQYECSTGTGGDGSFCGTRGLAKSITWLKVWIVKRP